jgi:glycosyltransferase involved in cell wall biosynthesis
VLPSKSENFGMVVAEALAARTPVITTKGAPWQELETHRCGWWIDMGVESLIEALEKAMSHSPVELHEMGRRGRQLVEEKYTWDRVAGQMIEVYEWLLGRGPRPDCVVT